jgi:hypothetical protein
LGRATARYHIPALLASAPKHAGRPTLATVLTVYREAVRKNLDAVVAAEPEGSSARVTALEKAFRLIDAHAEAKKRTAGAGAGWEDWVLRARSALWIEDVADVRLAVQRAWQLGAKRPLLPQLEAALPAPRR